MPNLSVRAIRYGRTDEVTLKYTILCFFFNFFRPSDYWKEKGRRKSHGGRLLSEKYVTSFR